MDSPSSEPLHGQAVCYLPSTCLHLLPFLHYPLPPFLHSLLDFVLGFMGTTNQLQRQIKAAGDSNTKTTLAFHYLPF